MVGENLNRHPENVQFETSEGLRRRHLTKEAVISYALYQLGFPVIDIEAETQQFEAFFESTYDLYNRYKPVLKTSVLKTVSSQINRYNLRDLNMPYGRRVVDAVIVSRDQFFSPISGVFALGIPHPISHLSPDQYDLALRYINESKKIYSSAMDWEWEEPILWIYSPSGFGGPFSVAYTYTADAAVPADIPDYDHLWFKRYFYYQLMLSVGEARVKFDTVPGPFMQRLNGESMVNRAERNIEKLEKRIESDSYAYTPPLGPHGKI